MTSVTQSQCDKNAKACHKNNILPLMQEIKKLSQQFNDFRVEIAALPSRIIEKTDEKYGTLKDQDRIDKALNKVMWTSVTSLIGFLITAIWFLIDKILK